MSVTAAPALPGSESLARARILSPAPRDVWTALLHEDPCALPTQTPEWTDWLCRTRGYSDASRLFVFPDGRRLLLPLLARRAAGLRATEESMPYGFGYGGPLVPGGQPTPDETRAIVADLASRSVIRSSLVANPLTADGWAAAAPPGTIKVPYLAHVLDLDGGFGHVWAHRFRKDVRRNVRRATEAGVEVRTGGSSEMAEAFGELNRRSVDRWADQRGQPRWLARLAERRRGRPGQLASAGPVLGPMLATWTAHLDGEPVAAYATLLFGEQAYSWMSAMDKGLADRTGAGVLLRSLAIEQACDAGARWFHFGESDPGSGVAAFKERFGATPRHYTALRFERLPITRAEQRVRATLGRLTERRHAPTGPGEP
jgi:hypothetical protein